MKLPRLKDWVEITYIPKPYQTTIQHPDQLKYLEDCEIKVVPNPYHWSNLNLGFITVEITPTKPATMVEPLVELHQAVSEELSQILSEIYKDNGRKHFVTSNFYIYYFECDWEKYTVEEYFNLLVEVLNYIKSNLLPKYKDAPEYQQMIDYFKEKFDVN